MFKDALTKRFLYRRIRVSDSRLIQTALVGS